MAPPRQFRRPMTTSSTTSRSQRTARQWRMLLAHDATASTCDGLVSALGEAFEDLEIVDASSVDDARATLARSRFDACLICLDLPPAPSGGVRLAQTALRDARNNEPRTPVVLVTRSLRWLPANATELRTLPWVTPDAEPGELAKAVADAYAMSQAVPAPPASDVVLKSTVPGPGTPRRQRRSVPG